MASPTASPADVSHAARPGSPARLGESLDEPQKSRLNVRRQGTDLRGDGFVQNFDGPRHDPVHLVFEIDATMIISIWKTSHRTNRLCRLLEPSPCIGVDQRPEH